MRFVARFLAGIFGVLGVLGVFGTSGCSGSGSNAQTAGVGDGSIAQLCDSYCGWQKRCAEAGKNLDGCAAECRGESERYQGKWSATYLRVTSECFADLACDKSDDACVANFQATDSAHPDIPEVKACLAKRQECAGGSSSGGDVTGSTFQEQLCLSITALVAASRATASECLKKGCGEIGSCLGEQAGAFSY